MCLVILLCTRASPQGPGFPCQRKGLTLPGNFLAKGVFFQSPAAQRGALGAARWEQLSQALLGIRLAWVWLQEGGKELSPRRVTMAAPQRRECGEREHRARRGCLLLSWWG